jgi:flagellar motility protein MotE (MotC chaperone)
MFGNKSAKNWDSVKANLRKLLGEDLTDAELVDKVMNLKNLKADTAEDVEDDQDEAKDKEADKAEVEEKPKKAADTDADDDEDDDDAEKDAKPSDITALSKQIATLTNLIKAQSEDLGRLTNRVQGLEKGPGRKATSGERDIKETPKKGEYTDKQAPFFPDED